MLNSFLGPTSHFNNERFIAARGGCEYSGVKADQIKAMFDKGVLKITLPKVDEAKKKEIEVKVK